MSFPQTILQSLVQTVNLLTEVGASEVYRAQAARARDPKTAAVLRRILAHEATHACEARARVPAPDGVVRLAEAAVGAGAGLIGRVTALGGDRVALAFDYALERVIELGQQANLMLLPDDGNGSDRKVLKRVLEEEREHQALIRDRLGL
jgi:demethoxyubiquinone hydroxylase (CLK1/Coq7/Cat5 family)